MSLLRLEHALTIETVVCDFGRYLHAVGEMRASVFSG